MDASQSGDKTKMSAKRKLAFGVATSVGLWVAVEAALRLVGVSYAPTGRHMVFGMRELFQRDSHTQWYIPDAVLFWRMKPSAVIPDKHCYPPTGYPDLYRGYYYTNSDGFRDGEFSREKPTDVFRIVCLGDSCTFGVGVEFDRTYPQVLEAKLNESVSVAGIALQPRSRSRQSAMADPSHRQKAERSGLNPGESSYDRLRNGNESGSGKSAWGGHSRKRFEAHNMGVTGYSSLQGLRLLRTQALAQKPDVVVIYFGWNDHYPAHHYIDSEQKLDSETTMLVQAALRLSRAYQCLEHHLLLVKYGLKGTAPRNRVPLGEYAENLRRMAAEARQAGAVALFVVAPAREPDDAHKAYCEVVRRTAKEAGALVADVAADFAAKSDGERANLFLGEDPVHPNVAGHALIAEHILRALHALLTSRG